MNSYQLGFLAIIYIAWGVATYKIESNKDRSDEVYMVAIFFYLLNGCLAIVMLSRFYMFLGSI